MHKYLTLLAVFPVIILLLIPFVQPDLSGRNGVDGSKCFVAYFVLTHNEAAHLPFRLRGYLSLRISSSMSLDWLPAILVSFDIQGMGETQVTSLLTLGCGPLDLHPFDAPRIGSAALDRQAYVLTGDSLPPCLYF